MTILQGKARYPVTEVILHCAAIRTAQFRGFTPFQAFAEIDRWHKERGFSQGFGYHGLVMPDGVFFRGRPYSMIGAHCIERNRGSLGILLIESSAVTRVGDFADFFTPAQRSTVSALLTGLYSQGVRFVSGHNNYASKLCPGFDARREFARLPAVA
jgi:N-acetylmuramoyl-L-alanine amidase